MTELSSIELYTNPDHRVWAKEFCRIAREKGFDPSSAKGEEWVGTWIASAMMHGEDSATDHMNFIKARAAADEREDAEALNVKD